MDIRERTDVYVVPGFMESQIQRLFRDREFNVVSKPEESNILVFCGGADINPELYGDQKHPQTYYTNSRDKREVELYRQFADPDYLKIGICRGHQLLAAMNGGKLFQHVNNHGQTHDAFYTDENGQTTIHAVSSAHHQMFDMERSAGPFEPWLVSNEASTRESFSSGQSFTGSVDPEGVFWPTSNSMGFQGHPEFGPDSCTDLFFRMTTRALQRYRWRPKTKLKFKSESVLTGLTGNAAWIPDLDIDSEFMANPFNPIGDED